MEFGMPTLIEIYDLEESAKLCKELGLKFIELNMTFPQYQIAQMEETERLRTIADKYGIYYTIHLDETMDVCNFNPLVADAYMETLQRTIEVAKKLNIPSLNMHMLNGIYVTLPDKKVCMYQEYIDSYMHTGLSLDTLCKELYISKSYLHQLFMRYLQISPKRYITSKRLLAAQLAIRSGARPTDIYTKFGFLEYSSFYRAYCKQFGYAPSEELSRQVVREILF